jgi:hypothetical protein
MGTIIRPTARPRPPRSEFSCHARTPAFPGWLTVLTLLSVGLGLLA